MAIDVARWPQQLGLEQYEPAFRDNDIDGDVLPDLTAEDLIGMGVTSIGHRRARCRSAGRPAPRGHGTDTSTGDRSSPAYASRTWATPGRGRTPPVDGHVL